MSNFAEQFNKQAIEIWKNTNHTETLMPFQYASIKVAELVIVGINLSFNKKYPVNIKINSKEAITNMSDLYLWKEGWENRHQYMINHEIEFEQTLPFFTAYRNFSKKIGYENQWQHLDLFALRGTNQAEVLPLILENRKNLRNLNSFGKLQIELFKEMITKINPNIVVIANATAAKILIHAFEINEELNNNLTKFSWKELPKTTFFLSGMLMGGRSMDTHSMQRLVDQINDHKAK